MLNHEEAYAQYDHVLSDSEKIGLFVTREYMKTYFDEEIQRNLTGNHERDQIEIEFHVWNLCSGARVESELVKSTEYKYGTNIFTLLYGAKEDPDEVMKTEKAQKAWRNFVEYIKEKNKRSI